MKAIILCAGFGTRLYPVTKDRPKQLLPVGNQPILERILERLEPIEDLDQTYVVTNDRFYPHFESWYRTYDKPVDVELVNDGSSSSRERLGAIKDIQYVIEEKEIEDDLLVIAGDNLMDFDLTDFVNFFYENGTVVGLKEMDGQEVKNYSVVETAPDHRLTNFTEKPAVPKHSTISIGLYLFRHKHLVKIQKYLSEGNNPDEPGYLIQWLHKQVPVYGYPVEGKWYDIGDISSYNEANEYMDETEQGGHF